VIVVGEPQARVAAGFAPAIEVVGMSQVIVRRPTFISGNCRHDYEFVLDCDSMLYDTVQVRRKFLIPVMCCRCGQAYRFKMASHVRGWRIEIASEFDLAITDTGY